MSTVVQWYDDIREHHRVMWHPETQSWYVTRFDDIWELLVDNRLGSRSMETFTRRMTDEQAALCTPVLEFISKWPVFSDVPRHTSLHRLILPIFGAAQTRRLADVVRACLEREVDAGWYGADLLRDAIRPAFEAGLADFLGISRSDLKKVPKWATKLMAFAGRMDYDHQVMTEASVALREFSDFVLTTCVAGHSVLSATMREALNDNSLDRSDVVAVYGQMITGFLQPTLSATSMAVQHLVNDPDGVARFRAAPEVFIEESVRLASPFHYAPRRTLEDIEIDNQVVPADQRIVLLLVSANRDPRQFPEPMEFRMDRGRPPHIAFARGRYACLGAALSRQLIHGVLDAVVARPSAVAPRSTVNWSIGRGMRMAESMARSSS